MSAVKVRHDFESEAFHGRQDALNRFARQFGRAVEGIQQDVSRTAIAVLADVVDDLLLDEPTNTG